VDGREITRADVDKAFRRVRDPSQTLSAEEELTAKLSLLSELIVQDILLARAQALKVDVPESDLESAFAEARKNIPDDAFQQELERRSVTAADMREALRRELLTEKLIEREVVSKVTVTDQEVSDFFAANRQQFNFTEEAYHLAQIVVTPVREPQVLNRTGDDAATADAAKAKLAMLMERLTQGASFQDLALDYSEDPETAPRGGDLGLVPRSAVEQAPPALRDAALKAEPGTTRVVSQDGAHTIVFVVAREAAGQRDLSTPGVREGITETLRARREQVLRAAYLTAARDEATIENHLARRLVESRGKLPAS
jgi:parvulin-like peptidyl-prolyl isomerase